MKVICLDSSGWIEIATGGPNAQAFLKAFHPSHSVLSSTISLYEISKYLTREVGEAMAGESLSFVRNYPVIAVTDELALHAAELASRHKLAMADSLIYATALAHNAVLWTQDDDFKNLPHVKYYPKKKD